MRGNGAAVALVRQARHEGWTQAKLAAEAGLSQGYISKVENGQLDLTGDELAAVAYALQVPAELLAVRDNGLGAGVSCVHHRRRKSRLSATGARRIEGLTQLISLSVTRLAQELPQADVPSLPAGENGPAVAARTVRAHAGVAAREPISDVIAFAESLGVLVVRRDFGTDAQDGVSLRVPGRRPVIVVNTALPGDRLRLSVAHELGHLVLHGWQVSTGEQQVEDEAFAFARELIAPEAAVRAALSGLTPRNFGVLLELKPQWGMSVAAFIEYARHLGAVDEEVHRTLRMRLHTLGWRLVEPGPVPEENPHLINRILDAHLDVLGRSVEQVATTALMLPDPFQQHYLAHRRASWPEEAA